MSDTVSEDGTTFVDECNDNEYDVELLNDIEDVANEVIEEYMETHILNMSKPDFYDTMMEDVLDIIMDMIDACAEDGSPIYTKEMVSVYLDEILSNYWELVADVYPQRSENSMADKQPFEYKTRVANILGVLSGSLDNQGTEEWYMTRNSVITASSAWKVFGSQAQQNSLIYEKCCNEAPRNFGKKQFVTTNTMQHGHKYEPVSVLLYEYFFKTKVQGYGCIIHPRYSFLGASPDGINVDPFSSRYGRMIEVKNIVNREITGIPKEEYWIQMQIQMEVCDLETCDFIETRFNEYATEEECYSDTDAREYRGLILYFTHKENSDMSRYEYLPPTIQPTPENRVAVDEWVRYKKMEMLVDGYSLCGQQYWYLDEFSCLLVRRNREWFRAAIKKIEEVWNTIQKEKVSGYSHRAPQKKAIEQSYMLDMVVTKLDYNNP
jgi:putative phage-type endonuclease